jgi:hypothetical protein
MVNSTIVVILLATVMVGLMIGATLSLQPQQARAVPSDFMQNGNVHQKCYPDGTCDFHSNFVTNSEAFGHFNCSVNSHRASDLPKCNEH